MEYIQIHAIFSYLLIRQKEKGHEDLTIPEFWVPNYILVFSL